MSDKGICELLRRELEGKDEECKHGSEHGSTTFCRTCCYSWRLYIVVYVQNRHFLNINYSDAFTHGYYLYHSIYYQIVDLL